MERKIGEIFEHNGDWCQCVESKQDVCTDCAFNPINGIGYNCSGSCTYKQVIFKKLEKVGEPYNFQKKTFQTYKIFTTPFFSEDTELMAIPSKDNTTIEIEIKQNKEDMEEKKQKLDDLVGLYTSAKITYKEFDEKLKTLYADKEECKSSLKEFDLEAAKAGKPVCTRNGRKARIICFDFRDADEICCIIAAVDYEEAEKIHYYDLYGKYRGGDSSEYDLMMLPEKKEGWFNDYEEALEAGLREAVKLIKK